MVDQSLIETLRDAQRFGFFGPGPIETAAAHAQSFVAAIDDVRGRLCDLGSGGGLPGLVIAAERPDLEVVLVDRRQKRTDFLERAVRRHGWSHVVVRHADVEELVAEVGEGTLERYDAITARGFGPPEITLRVGRELMVSDGRVVISEPPTGDRWPAALLADLGLVSTMVGGVRVFRVVSSHRPD